MIRPVLLPFLAALFLIVAAQKMEGKGSPEVMPQSVLTPEQEVISRVEGQLLNALAMLESLQEETVKVAEKRRNKFEFIRFGRK